MSVSGDAGLGRLKPSLDDTESRVKRIGSELGGLGGKLMAGFSGIAIGTMVGGLLQQGVNSLFAKVQDGVIGINKQLETTTISLAAVMNSNGLTDSIEGGLQRATGWMAQLKKDAKELPGEFEDLVNIVQSGAGAAFQIGLDERSFGSLAAQAMAAGKALSVDAAQAGRDLARLLGGSAGMDNMLGSRLGFTADNFNGLEGTERIEKITTALGKFQPAIKVFGQTFDAQSSTLADSIKGFTGAATSDLFSRITGALSEVNAWFEQNQSSVKLYADKVGKMLTNAWDDGRKFIEDWGPSLLSFANRFYDRFIAVWRDVEPYVSRIAKGLKEAFDNPETFNRLETLLKLYAGSKVLGGASSLLGGSGLGSAALGMLGSSGLATGAKSALWAGGELASGLAGQAAGAIGGAGAGSVALIAGVVTATIAAVGAAGYEVYSARDRATTYDAKGGGAYGYDEGTQKLVDGQVARAIAGGGGAESARRAEMDSWRRDNKIGSRAFGPDSSSFENYGAAYDDYIAELKSVNDAHAEAEDRVRSFADATFETSEAMGDLQSIIAGLAKSGDFEAISKINQGLMDAQQQAAFGADDSDRNTDMYRLNAAALGIQAINALDKAAEKAKQKKAVEGASNVNIARVEITISNNNAPGQVARDVAKELVQMKRFRRTSPSTLNVTAGR